MNQLQAMRAFARVVDLASFNLAAGQLGVSPAAVTRRIVTVEAHLNTRLLNRTTRWQPLVVQLVAALVTVRANAERGETETSFTLYYVPLDARRTATRVASRKGQIPGSAFPYNKAHFQKKRVSEYAVSQKRRLMSND
jgi:hypothetical protein